MTALLIQDGHVIDPSQKIDGIQTIAILDKKIVSKEEVQESDPVIIQANDCYVFPGLINFHAHLYSGSVFGINPELLPATGVTAAVDAGTAGWINFKNFYQGGLSHSQMHLKAFINVSGIGQPGGGINEPLTPNAIHWTALDRQLSYYKDKLLGLKIRISKPIVGSAGVKPLLDTFQFAHERGIRVCVHVTNPIIPFPELLPLFQKGDIFCHVFEGTGNHLLGTEGKVVQEAWQARERGVIFDAANGRSNFSYAIAKKALQEGFLPDVISSDSTSYNFNLPEKVKNLPFIMSKYLNMGMTLPQIIERVTAIPAKLMGMEGEIGTLAPGASGDVTICKLVEQEVIFRDSLNTVHYGTKVLVPVMTILKGSVVYCNPAFN